MIQGHVSERGIPTISLSVAGADWPATVDTGFNGDLELPEALRMSVNPRFAGQVTSSLAGGQVIKEDSFFVEFPFDGETALALATFVPAGNILIGTKMLRQHRLLIRFSQKIVELERE